jgi:hypothetical protein
LHSDWLICRICWRGCSPPAEIFADRVCAFGGRLNAD